jgi:cardiolipin synthase C
VKLAAFFLTAWIFATASANELPTQVTYLEAPKEALSALYKSIATAQRSIELSYYEAQPCHTVTKVLVRAIRERRQQVPNLKVRFLFDAHPIADQALIYFPEFLRQNGIEARVFNNTFKMNPRYNYRNHSKYLVTDQRLVTGGRNLTDNYYGLRRNEINWIDGDLLVENGRAISQAQKHFQNLWTNNHTYQPEKASSSLMSQAKSCLSWGDREENLLNFLKQGHLQYLNQSKAQQCSQVTFVADDMDYSNVAFDWEAQTQIGGGFDKLNLERVAKKPTIKALVRFLTPAKKITLVNHIYIPFGKISEILEQKRGAGVPISLYTSYYRGSGYIFEDVHNYYVKEDSRGSQKNYAISTVSRPDLDWEFSPKGLKYSNHGKLYIVNSRDVGVTSINFDPRSYMHNVESGAFVQNCEGLASHIEKSYSRRMMSGLSTQEQNGVQRRLRGQYDHPVTTPSDQTLAWLLTQFL